MGLGNSYDGGDSGKAGPVEGKEVEELRNVHRGSGSWVQEVLSLFHLAAECLFGLPR